MNELPPLLRDQRKIDADHLKFLAIFHFIGAGLALLGILFLLFHFTIFHIISEDPTFWQNQKQGPGWPPPAIFFTLFKIFYLVFGTWFLISGILNVISGLCLRVHKHRTFSLVVAGINCLHFPLGTALGVFTIIVLLRGSVRELYEVPPRV